MLPALASLIELQRLDSAADAARRRIGEMPAIEKSLDKRIADAKAVVDAVKARLAENDVARRALEKETAIIDGRMARFEEHKAAVKTNQEFHALNHEIEVAQQSKAALDDQVLALLTTADDLTAERKAAEAALASTQAEVDQERAALKAERVSLERELASLASERQSAAPAVPAPVLAKYDQIAKNRKGIAVARMTGAICGACHVRLRPHIEQQIRRNDAITQCDSCQRILYFIPPPAASDTPVQAGP